MTTFYTIHLRYIPQFKFEFIGWEGRWELYDTKQPEKSLGLFKTYISADKAWCKAVKSFRKNHIGVVNKMVAA